MYHLLNSIFEANISMAIKLINSNFNGRDAPLLILILAADYIILLVVIFILSIIFYIIGKKDLSAKFFNFVLFCWKPHIYRRNQEIKREKELIEVHKRILDKTK